MTNAEKYQQVFGFEPDLQSCPALKCLDCPCYEPINHECAIYTRSWWIDEYKEAANE